MLALPGILLALVAAGATPQTRVLCRGDHALCSSAQCSTLPDGRARCMCYLHNDTFAVSVGEILSATIQAATARQCTTSAPCATNAAPVCLAIAAGAVFDGQFAAPGLVSTFSWTGWCDATRGHKPAACPPSPWAACMTAPCERLSATGAEVECWCPVRNSSWEDFGPAHASGRRCQGVVSTVPAGFDMRVMPGAEYALAACAQMDPGGALDDDGTDDDDRHRRQM